MQPIKFIHQEK